jgi:TPP-dependent pyruvate/acetoin dehydrogenase alpha subunit
MPVLSLRAYAEHRGVSLAAVQKAIDYALSSPEPKLSEAYTDVFAEGG